MSKFKIATLIIILSGLALAVNAFKFSENSQSLIDKLNSGTNSQNMDIGGLIDDLHPLSIELLRKGEYPGSEIVIEQTLESGSNYYRSIASYKSEDLKIYALLTIPNGTPPEGGWPVIIFNHGYIPPKEYRTTEKYAAYVDGFARNGLVVFRPDYRGHGSSEGEAAGAYGSSAYTIDVLNAMSSVKKLKDVNPARIGMWGHSLGGYITLRSMVISKEIKAGVIWAGVVGSYEDLLNNWRRRQPSPQPLPSGARRWRQELVEKYGEPQTNRSFWNSISANSYLSDISGPLQLHHGSADESVPILFSQNLEKQMKEAGKEVELFTYDGNDHNLSQSFSSAMQRSIDFFKKHL